MDLKNKVALVTGAGMGIGKAVALKLAENGADIIVNDVESAAAEELAAYIEGAGGDALSVSADVSDWQAVCDMVQIGIQKFGTIDILVNNAGIGSLFVFEELTPEAWERTLRVTLTGAFNCCKAVTPCMIEKKRGKIIFIGSTAAERISTLAGVDYTAAKSGLLGLNRQLAYELAEHGINVNLINPGITFTERARKLLSKEERQRLSEKIPLGDLCEPGDIAEAVAFLASDGARMITGQRLTVDGGWMLGLAAGYSEDMKKRHQIRRKNHKA